MLGKKSKIFVLVGMVALLVITGVLNVVLNRNAENASVNASESANSDFFATYRTDRTQTREQSILYYDAIIASETSTEDAIKTAETEKLALTTAMETELVLEGLIKAVGFEDAVVTTTSENVNVILRSGELTTEQVAKVLEIVTNETGKRATSVRIIPVE